MTPEQLIDWALSGCKRPGCDHLSDRLSVLQNCHPKNGLKVTYYAREKVLRFQCKQCIKDVLMLELCSPIAEQGPQPVEVLPSQEQPSSQ
jgi:hypothetical protein